LAADQRGVELVVGSRLTATGEVEELVAAPAEPAAEAAPWPTEADEAAFQAEARAQAGPALLAVVGKEEAPPPRNLPALDELVARVPAEARAALDDLFRAKFTAVRRVSAKQLKPSS
jgi:hypothetical protein